MNPLVPKVAVAALASPMEVGADRAPAAAAALADLLERSGAAVVRAGVIGSADQASAAGRRMAAEGVDAVGLAGASWFEDYLALDLLEEWPAPLLLWPLPGMETGALCGTQQLTCLLRQLDRPSRSVFGPIEAGRCAQEAMAFLRAAALRGRLRRMRIGLAGQRVPGMIEAAADEIALKKALGPRVVGVDMPGLLRCADEQPPARRQEVWQRVAAAAGAVEVPESAGLAAAGMYLAIRDLAARQGLAALAFGCYPDYMGRACLPASLLADEGVVVGCEGDVNLAVAQVILQLLTAWPTHNTDWLDPLPDGSVVFSHCGSGSHTLASRLDAIRLAPVRLAHCGVCSLFPARPGPVTLLGLLPRGGGYQAALLEGEAVETDLVFPGNPLRVRFHQDAARIIRWIHDEGVGHHWAAGCGHVAAEIRDWARLAGPSLRLVEMP